MSRIEGKKIRAYKRKSFKYIAKKIQGDKVCDGPFDLRGQERVKDCIFSYKRNSTQRVSVKLVQYWNLGN